MSSFDSEVTTLRNLLKTSFRIVIFTGAGISTESGVSDYRSQGGLWKKYQPVTIQEFLADEEKRREYWIRKKEMFSQIREAKPNLGHLAIATIEKRAEWAGLITQNIDGFHQLAGSLNILEIHGTNREAVCLNCEKNFPFEQIHDRLLAGEEIPFCEICGGLLKPNTISFGQALDQKVLNQAMDWAGHCDLMLAIGSTLIVEPAASLPRIASEAGATLVILNKDPTPLDDIANLVIHAPAGEFLDKVVSGENT